MNGGVEKERKGGEGRMEERGKDGGEREFKRQMKDGHEIAKRSRFLRSLRLFFVFFFIFNAPFPIPPFLF